MRLIKYIRALRRVAKISAQIYKVTSLAFTRKVQVPCPHGIVPSYPAHAWWCDKCWWELRDALDNLDEVNLSILKFSSKDQEDEA